VFHLSPDERASADISPEALRTAFRADIDAQAKSRRQYVDVHLDELDLSTLVVDGDDVDRLVFENVTVDEKLDLSGAVVRHPIVVRDSEVGQIDAATATFEADFTVTESEIGTPVGPATCLRARRATFEESVEFGRVQFDGSLELAACAVGGWLDFDTVTVTGRAHFPKLSVGTAQFVSTTFQHGAEFVDATGGTALFESISTTDAGDILDLSGVEFDLLRVCPQSDLTCHLEGASISAGRLDQSKDAVARYELTDATVGDVEIDRRPDSLDRYRFYRTQFDGFPFTSLRAVLRANRWRIHDYVGTPVEPADTEGLEHTYLEATRGASSRGDNETASMFFVRELRYRRQRYAAHALASDHSPTHRVEATLRWVTNGFLDGIAGYGERPQRTLALSVAVVVGSALAYPAGGGLVADGELIRYGSHGLRAALDGLYFSVVTFATLGLGDVHPAGDIGRFIAASEGLAGAFLTAIFVFSLGRRVTR
jgi:hypothetical protein